MKDLGSSETVEKASVEEIKLIIFMMMKIIIFL